MGQKIAHIYNLAVIKNLVFKNYGLGIPTVLEYKVELRFESCAIFEPLYFGQVRNYLTAVPFMLHYNFGYLDLGQSYESQRLLRSLEN